MSDKTTKTNDKKDRRGVSSSFIRVVQQGGSQSKGK
jgi:hypothetical protein